MPCGGTLPSLGPSAFAMTGIAPCGGTQTTACSTPMYSGRLTSHWNLGCKYRSMIPAKTLGPEGLLTLSFRVLGFDRPQIQR
jgi:hypothetical protein